MSQAPGSLDEVPYQFISGEEELECLVTELSQCSEFAIDLEVCSVWCFLVLYTCQHSFHTSYLFSDCKDLYIPSPWKFETNKHFESTCT